MAKLDELNVPYKKSANKAELEALLAKNMPANTGENLGDSENGAADEEASKGENTSNPENAGSTNNAVGDSVENEHEKVDIFGLRDDGQIGYVRTYSRERHGDDYVKLANQFVRAPKHAYRKLQVVEHNPAIVAAAGGEK